MSYFIFKGVHSYDMGLIVESLPPIVKPPKRYNVIKIDGSSKIKIENLGYDTYEKKITVGFNNNDIWRVMDWLDGEGKLILSNELDKYYDAYIVNQIDYERALRFRKATINFLVQPYKHYYGEEETTSRIVINQGNTVCLPLMTIYGNGHIEVNVNGIRFCTLTNIDEYITLDGEEQEAYKGDILQNRMMIGKFPELLPGENEITFTGPGTVTEVKTLVRSRWL